ncbi:serine/threonine-protein kinase [Aliterella atlantica]|uniref:non-specific serine/threonine protein kinase n=1 Tax=Aliterella atlantica CENA595 TaxID=1618023 RepID=A0A0D8ZP00_9CYAN|nr:serine/threonine-protein kinase [Aliterella atlantica]KJH70548.1 hypothetical protein UH38_17415 [Aliterella atlantica CENA595]
MNPIYCSQGHENASNSRFCFQCGEQLTLAAKQQGIYSGLILGDRYRIIKQLGQGGFGRTYLAEDINRFSEMCVLKEFAPQVQSNAVLQKAEELFAREAGVLYKLQHPQIPRFRELFRVSVDGKGYLFLVQDYVEGQNYYSVLAAHQPQRFSETEVRELLLNILPVLEYIHSLGVIHRDISPDNLILRASDSLPVLIDFGGVKQVAATVSQLEQAQAGKATAPPTLLGKVGFAPNEQMRTGAVYPHSDLYALAVTILVLLTGKHPQALIDDRTLSWQWEKEVNVSPNLTTVLNKMLQPNMSDRYQNARQVWQAINVSAHEATFAAPAYTGASVMHYQPPVNIDTPQPEKSPLGKILLGALILLGLGGATFWGISAYLQTASNPPVIEETTPSPIASASPSTTPTPSPSPPPQLSAAEQAQAQTITDQRRNLGIDDDFYFSVMNQLFWAKYPQYQGRKLTNEPKDAQGRSQWYEFAEDLLSKLETLSQTGRQKLGKYTAADRDRSVTAISQVYVGSRSLYDLADAAFFELFPEQRGKEFINLPIGQIWNAIVVDKASEITNKKNYEQIAFAPGTTGTELSGSLIPGEGKVYIAHLQQQQKTEINLKAEPQLLISIYSPTGKVLLADSTSRTWSGTLQEDGFYEIVVVSNASATKNYELALNVENTTPEVTEPETTSPSPDLETSPSP